MTLATDANHQGPHPEVRELAQRVDRAIDDVFQYMEASGVILDARVREYVKRGKMVRPVSLLLWVAAMSPDILDEPRVLRAAAAVEIAHRSTLVSDDVVDGQKTRNSEPTIEASVGRSVAILAAPFLHATAVDACPPEFREVLNSAIHRTLAGQIEQETHHFVSLRSALDMNARVVQLKSGSIETAALHIGAALVGGAGSQPAAVGAHFARAYQTCNDLADLADWLAGRTAVLPRDLQNQTFTYPILTAMNSIDADESELVLRFMHRRGELASAEDLRGIFLNAQVYSRCLAFITAQLRSARELLAGALRPGAYRDLFIQTAESTWKIQYLTVGG